MQRLIIHFIFLASMSLVAMNEHQGMWDEHGNYLGPANYPMPPLPNTQPMMPVHVLYVPVNQYVQPLPMMGQPLPFMQPTYHYPHPGLPNVMPPFVPPYNGNQMVYPQQPFFPVIDSQQWRAQAQPQRPHFDQEREIEVVTQEMQQIAIDDQSSQTASTSTVLDVDTFLSSLRAIHADTQSNDHDREMLSEDQDPSPAQSASLSPPLSSEKVTPIAQKKQQSDVQSVGNNKKYDISTPNQNNSQVSSSVPSSPPKLAHISNGQLVAALATMRKKVNAPSQLQQLAHSKFEWVDTLDNESDRIYEWQSIAQLFEQSNDFAAEVTVPEQATAFMHLADTLVENAEKIDKKIEVRKQFARLALGCLERIVPVLPPASIEQASNISDRASALVGNRQGVEDQSNVKETDFYDGHEVRVAEVAIRSDGKCLPAVVGRMQPEGDVHLKKGNKVPNTKQKQPKPVQKKPKPKQPKPAQNNSQSGKVVVPKPVVPKQESKEVPLKERIERLLKGNVKQTREGMALLEQVAEGKIPGLDHDDQMWALMCEVGLRYLEAPDDAPDLDRAQYFLRKAHEAGDLTALIGLVSYSLRKDKAMIAEYVAQVHKHPKAEAIDKEYACLMQELVPFIDNAQAPFPSEALARLQKIHDHFSLTGSMAGLARLLPNTFYYWQHDRIKSDDWKKIQNRDSYDSQYVDWLYLTSRLYIDGDSDGDSDRFSSVRDEARTMMRIAAREGSRQAQLYVAIPTSLEGRVTIDDRVEYLAAALRHKEPQSQADKEHMEKLCDQYASEGFLEPILSICERGPNELDDALRKLENNPVPLRIGYSHSSPSAPVMAELERRASGSWVARSILSALEIAPYVVNHRNSLGNIQELDNARNRIADDVKAHPQLESVLGVYHAARAEILQHLAVNLFSSDAEKARKLMAQALRDFQEAIKRGEQRSKVRYGVILLTFNPRLCGDMQPQDMRAKGLKLLKEVADGNGEHTMGAGNHLIKHFIRQSDWDNAWEYINKGREYAKFIYSFDGVHTFEQFEKTVRQQQRGNARLSRIEKIRRINLASENNEKMIREAEQHLRDAYACFIAATECVKKDPTKAVKLLEKLAWDDILNILPNEPHMLGLFYTMIDEIVAVIKNKKYVDSLAYVDYLARDNQRMQMEIMRTISNALLVANVKYHQAANTPGYGGRHLEQPVRTYLARCMGRASIEAIIDQITKGKDSADLHKAVRDVLPMFVFGDYEKSGDEKFEEKFKLNALSAAVHNVFPMLDDKLNGLPYKDMVRAVRESIERVVEDARKAYQQAIDENSVFLDKLLSLIDEQTAMTS